MFTKNKVQRVISVFFILAIILSNVQASPVSAQTGDGIKRQINAESGKVNFIGPENGRTVPASKALGTFLRPQDPGMALAKRFAPEFGIKNPERDLNEMRQHKLDDGRLMVRYQQKYQGIPVLGGELIVNTNTTGDLYSMNGEVSPNLSLQTQPTIDAQQATQTALGEMAKWYQKPSKDFVVSQPALWIYDESLLQPSTRPAELVWRMEVTPKDTALPVRELVLVNAQKGNISLHFNQVDNAGASLPTDQTSQASKPTSEHLFSYPQKPNDESARTKYLTIASMPALSGGSTWYVATTGNDTNDCTTTSTPCATINAAIAKAASGDTINVAIGTYTGSGAQVVNVKKTVRFLGGWDIAFSTQNGYSTIDGEQSRQGILVAAGPGTVSFDRFVIKDGFISNSPSYDSTGGGIYVESSSLIIMNSVVYGNRANQGGGIFTYHADLTILNTTISGNHSEYQGGAISFNNYGSYQILNINNSTIAANTALYAAGGIWIYDLGSGGVGGETIHNSIISMNRAPSAPDCWTAGDGIDTANHNIISDPSGCTMPNGSNSAIDPVMTAGLVGNPGYHALFSNSPAIDAGGPDCLAIDERGVSRPQKTSCDIGAYEYPAIVPTIPVSLAVLNGNNQSSLPDATFSSAISIGLVDINGDMVEQSGVEIALSAPQSGPSLLFSDTGNTASNLTTNQQGIATASSMTANDEGGIYSISANSSGLAPADIYLRNALWYVSTTGNDSNSCSSPLTPCLTINNAINKALERDLIKVASGTYTDTGSTVVFVNKNLGLSGGWNSTFTNQSSYSTIDGQHARTGISTNYSSIRTPSTIDHFIILNGHTTHWGGGINHYRGILNINNSLIMNNQAQNGGGGIFSSGDLIINNSSIRGNSTPYNGGGIEMYLPSNSLTLDNSTIAENSAAIGGGISLDYASGGDTPVAIKVQNSTLIKNSGTGISIGGGSPRNVNIINTILAQNTNSNCQGIINLLDHSLLDYTTSNCSILSNIGSILNANPSLINNPLGPLGYYGLFPWSPAIDTGANCLSRDQRGVSRPQGSACDIGAFEYRANAIIPAYIEAYVGTPQEMIIGNSAQDNLKVYVFDANGDSVSGTTVTFAAPINGASATFANTSTNIFSSITDANGIAISPVLTANLIDGQYTIQATVLGVNGSADFQMTNVDPSRPRAIAIYSGSGQSRSLGKLFLQPLKARVTNYWGQPLSGVTVTYTAPASGASIKFANTGNNVSTSITDVNGIASSTVFSANNVEGSYVVSAIANSLATSTNFQLTNSTLHINTFTSNGTSSLPGAFLCNQTQPNCTNGVNPQADAAHKYATGVYNFYATHFLRDSIDNNGMDILSTVHYCDPYYGCNYDNAFWSGLQMVYGDGRGYAMADDVVAHELTHGVTQYESNLFYYYQSGAINESLSDVFGEYFDQTNNQGNDNANVKWLLGEDVTTGPSGAGGALRSMSNPTLFHDPDKMSSTYYYKSYGDGGGVHHNSGVNNKAAYLMVDGGSFNGKMVTGLGWEKVGALYYEANTNLLTSGSDYSDLYYALQQACTNLLGQHGITAGDCTQVKNALDAVEMNGQPAPNFNTDAPVCGPAQSVNTVFYDGLESGTANWTFNNGSYTRWQSDSPYGTYAHSGLHSLYADDYPDVVTDATATLTAINIPTGASYLRFAQAYDFESYVPYGQYYDGGVLEYTTNGGASWVDAGSLIDFNGYKGTISTVYGNPLSGRLAFVDTSHGYISTRLNLSSLAGQSVKFRWRMGLDNGGYYLGWYLDDVSVYTCAITLTGNAGMGGTSLRYVEGGLLKTVTADGSGTYSLTVPVGWTGVVTPYKTGYTFTPSNKIYNSLQSNQTLQNYQAQACVGCADVNATVGTQLAGAYTITPSQSQVDTYPLSNGPVTVKSTNALNLIAAERVIFSVNNTPTSYSELMGLPQTQVATSYLFPWYNNLQLNSQLRFGNVGSASTIVSIKIHGVTQATTYTLLPGQSTTATFPVSDGPVEVVSDGQNIIAAERVIFSVNGLGTSYSELMGLPQTQLATLYLFPWYNNLQLNSQLRFGNVGSASTIVSIKIHGVTQATTYTLLPGESTTATFPVSDGPVEVVSDGQNIIAAERVIFSVNNTATSYSEMMGLPQTQLATSYLFPWYNNQQLNAQLRFGNVGSASTIVSVKIHGVTQATTYTLLPGQSTTATFAVSDGPVEVVSDGQNIIAAERVIYSVNGLGTSYSELMGLPQTQLATSYLFPWYNNLQLNAQLRFAVP